VNHTSFHFPSPGIIFSLISHYVWSIYQDYRHMILIYYQDFVSLHPTLYIVPWHFKNIGLSNLMLYMMLYHLKTVIIYSSCGNIYIVKYMKFNLDHKKDLFIALIHRDRSCIKFLKLLWCFYKWVISFTTFLSHFIDTSFNFYFYFNKSWFACYVNKVRYKSYI
jgi:hypothetical protein